MSLLRPTGSTRAWRKLRRFILRRDGWACQVPVGQAQVCGQAALDCGHVVARHLWPPGRPGVDDPANLRAECARHNRRAGALLRHGIPPDTPPVDPYVSEAW